MVTGSTLNKFINKISLDYKWYYGIISLIAIAVSVQHYIYTPPAGSSDAFYNYTHYNNFLVFRQSFFHLVQHKNIYAAYPYEYYDLFKYTPTFALLMFPFAYLPNLAGLILWNMLNAVILFYAVRQFPFSSEGKKKVAAGFILLEAMTSFMISESNCLIAGLMILGYLAMEKKNIFLASFLVILSAFIKPFGLAALCLFIFYPKKWRAVGFSAFWSVLLLILPMLCVSPKELCNLYTTWAAILNTDHLTNYGLSVMSWLHTWFGFNGKNISLLIGLIILILPLLRYKSYPYTSFRQLYLACLLIWVVIFNHKAESPGYVIAVSGVAIWFSQTSFIQPFTFEAKLNIALAISCFLFTILSPTDLYPRYIREHYFLPYSIKAVPCIIIWVKIAVELLTRNFSVTIPEVQENVI